MAYRLGARLGFRGNATVVVAAPTISAQPTGGFYDGATAVTLSVTASGSPTYQWYIGNSGDTSTPVGGATNSSYAASPAAYGRYWCRATNAGGSADSNAVPVVPVVLTQTGEDALLTLSGANVTNCKPVTKDHSTPTFAKSGTTDWVQQAADADGKKAIRGSGDSLYIGPNDATGFWNGYIPSNGSNQADDGGVVVVVCPRGSTNFDTYLGASGGYSVKIEINEQADKLQMWNGTDAGANDRVRTGAVNKALKHAILAYWDTSNQYIALNGAAAASSAWTPTGTLVANTNRRITYGAGATFNGETNPTCDLFEIRILDHKPTANEITDIWALLTARHPSVGWA